MYVGRLIGPWFPGTFPRMSCSLFFLPVLFAALCGVRAGNEKETATTHGQLTTSVALDHRVDPTSDPTSELVIYAVSGPGKQPS